MAVGSMTMTTSAARRPGSRDSSGPSALSATGSSSRPKKTKPRSIVRPHPGERELDHDRDGALHVGGAEAVDGVGVAAAGTVVLRRDGVEVAGEQDERALAALGGAGDDAGVARVAGREAAGAQDAEHVGGERGSRRATRRGRR